MKIQKDIAISDSGFIFNPLNGESFSVNPLGFEIINMLKAEKSFSEIKKNLLHLYQTDEVTFEKDFNDFINVLKQYSLIDGNE